MTRVLTVALLALIQSTAVHAREVPDDSPYAGRGEIELLEIERALEEFGLEPHHDPYGLEVCEIYQRSFPIFFDEDVPPTWLNAFHRVTRERVVRRASTLEPGDSFTRRGFEDAERAIRDPFVFSVVAAVPVVSEEPGCVDVLLVTRDVWSLKLTFYFESVGSTLTELHFGLSEANVLGTNDSLSFGATRTRGAWSVGPAYLSRHVAGSRVTLYEDFDLIIDREVGGLEGTRNTLQVARPLYDSDVRWAWSTALQHDFSIQRRYIGAELSTWPVGAFEVEERYRSWFVGGSAAVTRSWGARFKHNLSPGWSTSWRDIEPVSYDPDTPEHILDVYERLRLPRSEVVIGPTLSYRFFENHHFRLIDYATYDVGEEIRQGHSLGVSLLGSEPSLGATARFVRQSASLSYLARLGDDAFVTARVENSMRVSDHVEDLSVSGGLRVVTPAFAAGRFVARVLRTDLIENQGNAVLSVGGDSALRGFAAGAFQGEHIVQANLEWRSSPIRIFATRVGMVAFVDAASAWYDDDPVVWHGAAGLGLRLVIPALSTVVRAGDVAFPFEQTTAKYRPVFTLGLEQAF